jgi:hypothetical protein
MIKEEKKYNFVYLTTNLLTGRRYVGDHSTNNMKCCKTKNYIGSGKLFLQKVKQYGRDKFKREDLEFFSTKQEAYDAQSKYIVLYETHVSQNGYNKDWKGGWSPNNFYSEELKIKRSNSMKGKNKGKQMSNEQKEKLRLFNTGKVVSEETKKKMSVSHVGKLSGYIHNANARLNMSNSHKGKTMSAEQKEKIRKSMQDYHKKRFL